MVKRDFDAWLSKFRASISGYRYYIDFDKVVRNVEDIKIELNILNSLIGSVNIEDDFEKIITKYPETLSCIPLLLAVRSNEIYAQDEDGAYFLYNMACSEEDYEKLVPGATIQVTGYKTEWSGEVEIIDATFEFVDGEFIAEPFDATELLGKDELIDHQNQLATFKGLTVEPAGKDADGNDVAFLYNWDGSGSEGDDLYFNVSYNGQTYSFVVESYLCDASSDVYAAVKALEIGQTIDAEGFLYWYEGVNPHITSVTVAE